MIFGFWLNSNYCTSIDTKVYLRTILPDMGFLAVCPIEQNRQDDELQVYEYRATTHALISRPTNRKL